MTEPYRTVVSSPRMSIRTKVCSRGNVYLYIGHTCIYLQADEFHELAQIIQATEKHMHAETEAGVQGH